ARTISLIVRLARAESDTSSAKKYTVPAAPAPSAAPRPSRSPPGTSGHILCVSSQPTTTGPNNESAAAAADITTASDRGPIRSRNLQRESNPEEALLAASSKTPQERIDREPPRSGVWSEQECFEVDNRRWRRTCPLPPQF